MMMPWNSKSKDSNGNSNRVYREIDERLRSLPFSDFQQIVLLWLSAKGYRHIRSLKRRFQRGRRPSGGADFVALMPNSSLEAAVQIRHWETPVSKRAVDELRGYLQRSMVPVGIIVAKSSFSEAAFRAALQYPGRPVRFLARQRLSAWLACSGLASKIIRGQEEIDEAFFRSIASLRLASAVSSSACSRNTDEQYDPEELNGMMRPEEKPSRNIYLAILFVLLLCLALSVWIWNGAYR